MASRSSNKAAVPEAKGALDKFKYEVANELGVPLTDGYNGDLTSRQNGSVGGYMVKKMIEAQGGNPNITEDYSLFKRAAYKCELKAEKSGYISSIDSEKIGMVALLTGAGRRNKNDNIDISTASVALFITSSKFFTTDE